MAENKQTFVLYEYLVYFWKKKIWFLIIPVILTILIAGLVTILKNNQSYVAERTVSTGSVNLQQFTNPDNIEADFHDVKNKLSVYVAEKGMVKFKLEGNSEQSVKDELESITNKFGKRLMDHSDERLKISKDSLATQEQLVKSLKNSLEMYNSQLASNNLTPTEYSDTATLVNQTETDYSAALETVSRMKSDFVFYEAPKLLPADVNKSKSYLKESIALGIILGLVLTVILLILMKYISDARRQLQHD